MHLNVDTCCDRDRERLLASLPLRCQAANSTFKALLVSHIPHESKWILSHNWSLQLLKQQNFNFSLTLRTQWGDDMYAGRGCAHVQTGCMWQINLWAACVRQIIISKHQFPSNNNNASKEAFRQPSLTWKVCGSQCEGITLHIQILCLNVANGPTDM